MCSLYFFITITNRTCCEKFTCLYNDNEVNTVFSTLCHGTAQRKTLDYLGIEKTEKTMMFSVCTREKAKTIMKSLVKNMRIDIPGNGIAITIPVSSIGGNLTMKCLTGTQEFKISEEIAMHDTPFGLIVVITDKGNIDLVMEAARSAKATGGTVIHAKGTGMENAEKFFGVSIASEKEMIFIVTKNDDKNNIMKAIMAKAGIHSKAHSIVFSLPVDSIAGLRSLEIDNDDL